MTKLCHQDLANLGKLLGYKFMDRGICRGFSCMWVQAVFAGDESSFFERLNFISSYAPDFERLKEAIEQAKEQLKAGEALDDYSQKLLQVLAFFDGIQLYLNPYDYREVFSGRYVNQGNQSIIYPVAKSEALEQTELKIVLGKSYAFTPSSLVDYLYNMSILLSQTHSEHPILLNNDNHSICLKYNKNNAKWSYIDTNDFERYPGHPDYFRELDLIQTAISIFRSLSNGSGNVAVFTTKVLASKRSGQEQELAVLEDNFLRFDAFYPVKSELGEMYDNLGIGLLYRACQDGQLAVVKALIRQGVDINKAANDGATPLYIACQDGHLDIVEELLRHKIDINKAPSDGVTPLCIACQQGHFAIVQALLGKEGISINKATNYGVTPLFIACHWGHVDIVQALLSKEGIDINKAAIDGVTPLFIACRWGHVDVVQSLINIEGIDINKAKDNGVAPLYIACQYGRTAIVELLLAKETIEVDAIGLGGNTPLQVACLVPHTKGNAALFELLLMHGASLTHQNALGQTALDIAIEQNNTAAIATLLNFMQLKGLTPNHVMSAASLEKAIQWSEGNQPEVSDYLIRGQQYNTSELTLVATLFTPVKIVDNESESSDTNVFANKRQRHTPKG